MRSSPTSAQARYSKSCLDDAQLIHHQYHPRRVGDEGRQGTFDVMKQFFGLMRGDISVARLVLILIFAASWSLNAQTAPPEQQGPPIIRTIDIQYIGPQTIARDKILAQMQT